MHMADPVANIHQGPWKTSARPYIDSSEYRKERATMPTRPKPIEITLHRKSAVLEMTYDDGARFRLPCEYLRVYSPSAEVRGHTPALAKLQVDKERVGIVDLQQIGHYAIKLFFDDGHNSGLFDWQYLYRLGSDWQPLWYEYLERLKAAGRERSAPDPFEQLLAEGDQPAELPVQ